MADSKATSIRTRIETNVPIGIEIDRRPIQKQHP